MSDELHFIQNQILKKLLFTPKLRYTDLRPSNEIENNKLNFHLNQLKDLNLIDKQDDFYFLTNKGKEFAGRLDTDKLKIIKQAKISIVICPIRDINEEPEYLIYTRLKSPFYGCQGFISGKVDYSEKVSDAAIRELKEETNLDAKPSVILLTHYLVFDNKSKDLLEDKFMFLSIANNPTGDLIASPEGKYEWVKESKLKDYITNPFESWEDFEKQLNIIKNQQKSFNFIEIEHYSEKF